MKKHKCIPVQVASINRLTGRGGKILKRPVTVLRVYVCKVCKREMTPLVDKNNKQK